MQKMDCIDCDPTKTDLEYAFHPPVGFFLKSYDWKMEDFLGQFKLSGIPLSFPGNWRRTSEHYFQKTEEKL